MAAVLQARDTHCCRCSPSPCTPNLTLISAGDKWKNTTISLDGLLDYDESDKEEVTFEMSLFAESFQDMLQRDYADLIFRTLVEQRWVSTQQQ